MRPLVLYLVVTIIEKAHHAKAWVAKERVLGAADKTATLEDVSSSPSIARFGRVAYPMRGKVTTHVLLGRKSHGCPMGNHCGRRDLGGEPTWRPEQITE